MATGRGGEVELYVAPPELIGIFTFLSNKYAAPPELFLISPFEL
jgi:hypothetical protein